ncbi:unnamed protein product [Alopecurus aequalis]
MDRRPWSDLPADILREISSRVCAPAQLVYFHAVCKHWRYSRDKRLRRSTTTRFLPWLLSPADEESTQPRFRCIFSKSTCHLMPPPAVPARNWVSAADGTALRYLTLEHHRPTLHDPFTRELTHLPDFPDDISRWEEENPRGVIYGDGTILLYNIWNMGDDGRMARFRAALLRPASDVWTVVERTLQAPRCNGEFCAAYHRGKLLLTVEATLWRIIIPEGSDHASDVLIRKPHWPGYQRQNDSREYSYVLMSRGQLLWVSVNTSRCRGYVYNRHVRDGKPGFYHVKVEHKISMTVHVLRKKKKTRWVEMDSRSLADVVLFLGTPISFSVDASRLSGRHGGCALFVYHDNQASPAEKVGVFSYDLVANEANFLERLPRGWKDERCTWHVVQPDIAPLKELMKAPEVRRQQTTLLMGPTLRRRYEPFLNVTVRNLPLAMKSSQLRLFLSEHGKVSRAEVLYYKNTRRSQGIAHVTMSTLHANLEDALDALNELSVDGYNLDVRLVKKGQQRHRRRPLFSA